MRTSTEIQSDLDKLNRMRVALDDNITLLRGELNNLNSQVPPLERELQEALATEARSNP